LTATFSFIFFRSFSQEKILLDKDFNEISQSSSSSVFYRVNPVDKKELNFTILDTLENVVGKESWKIDKYSGLVNERKIELFYPDGSLKESLLITEKGKEITYFYPDGKKKSVEKYDGPFLSTKINYNENGIYESEDKITKPGVKGGSQAWMNFIRKNLKYPSEAISSNAEGNVIVEFNILEDGKIENIHIKNKGENHPSLEEEAKRIVGIFNKGWIPMTINGKPNKSIMRIPIRFRRG
jgi:TonB family protein